MIILTYISGGFTLARLDLSSSFEVRYVLLALALFFIIVNEIKYNKEKRWRNAPTNLFLHLTYGYFIFLSLTVVYTTDISLYMMKMIDVVFLMLLLFITVYVLKFLTFDEMLELTTTVFVIVGIIYLIPVFHSVLSGSLRGTTGIGGPNVVTRVLFFSATSAWYKFQKDKKLRMLLFSFAFLAGIILVGSRGGIIGAVGTVSLFLIVRGIYKPKSKGIKISFKKIMYFLMPAAAVYYMWDYLERVFINRIIDLLIHRVYYSGRDQLYSYASNMIHEKPFLGYGLNGYTIVTGEVYPHNTLLEMMVETGVIGALYFLSTCIFTFVVLYKYHKSDKLIIATLPLYMQIVSMFSGDLYDFRYFFFFSVIMLYYMQPEENLLMMGSQVNKGYQSSE